MPLFPRLGRPDDALALEVDGVGLTWAGLRGRVLGQAKALEAQGLGPGARVGVWTQPHLDTLVALVANAALGLVSVPLDPKLGALELQHVLTDAAPIATLAADPGPLVGRAARVLPVASSSVDGPLALAPVDQNPCLILYTSGTTGLPKGAVLSAGNVAACLDGLAQAWRWTAADTVVHALPMFHVHGLVVGLFGALRAGGALRWVPRFEPLALAQALGRPAAEGGRAMLFAVPTMYHRLAEAAEAEPAVVAGLKAARLLVSGSAALPARDHARVEALTGQRVVERYGLTETLITCAVAVGDPPAPGTVGRPLPGLELRLVDDERRPAPSDGQTIAEVQVRGPTVFLGYLNRPEATAAVLDADGWFSTGDLATQRPDGVVRLVGRKATDLIKCGGYKVGAGEVEAALLEHPLVREAAVVGLPDADLGERIVAWVVLAPGEPPSPGALVDFVAGQLTPHKRPREVRVVDALPRNAMGKVLKQALRKEN